MTDDTRRMVEEALVPGLWACACGHALFADPEGKCPLCGSAKIDAYVTVEDAVGLVEKERKATFGEHTLAVEWQGRAEAAEKSLAEARERRTQAIQIRFDGPPGPEAGRFVEVEDEHGHGLSVGEWVQDGDYWLLKIPRCDPPPAAEPAHEHTHFGEPCRASEDCPDGGSE